ncbi:MAG: hypothetical protein QNJ97_09630 [Myxococcota bacterium]|nr:hypothetical protein [Myxococcota bacterium]
MCRYQLTRPTCSRGTTSVEELVLLATVAIGFAAGVIPLGTMLLEYHGIIECILGLPIP